MLQKSKNHGKKGVARSRGFDSPPARRSGLGSVDFQKRVEDFVCEVCGTRVKGGGYTDHCPKCLTSKHVDNKPGDRASRCGALMIPVSTEYDGNSFIIHYECAGCGKKTRVKAAKDDNEELLFSLEEKNDLNMRD